MILSMPTLEDARNWVRSDNPRLRSQAPGELVQILHEGAGLPDIMDTQLMAAISVAYHLSERFAPRIRTSLGRSFEPSKFRPKNLLPFETSVAALNVDARDVERHFLSRFK